jgi:hypothetical protein
MSTFNELIDFTRSTTGTYLDSVVYGPELVTNGTFDNNIDGWVQNVGTVSYVGGRLSVVGNGTVGRANISSGIPITVGQTYSVTVSVEGTANRHFVHFGTAVGSSDVLGNFTKEEGTGTYTALIVATTSSLFIQLGSIGSDTSLYDNVSVKEVIGGQVSGTPLLRTAAINEPRLEYDASGNPLGLLIEEARTNLVTYSDLSSGWNWVNTTDIGGAATAPDGTQTATLMRENTAGTAHIAFAAIVSASTSTTASIFAKAGGRRYLQLTDSTNQPNWAMFDLEQGVVTEQKSSGITATIEPYGNGWYRCNAALTLPASGSTTNFVWGSSILATTNGIRNVYQGDGTSGIYLWGGQVETGAFPTSYIPTSGSAVTRNRDLVSVPVERFGYNTAQCSVAVNFNVSNWIGLPNDANFYRVFEFEGNTGSSTDGIFRNPVDNTVRYRFNEDDGTTAAIGAANLNVVLANGNKVAVGLKGGSNYIVMDGGTDGQGAGTAATNLYSSLILSSESNLLNGHMKSLQYYPKRLSNEELQLLTQPSASPTMNLTFDGQATSTLVEGLHD